MPSNKKKIQDSVLPIGFAIIIFLMISTAFLTAKKVDSYNKSVQTIQTRTNNINSLLTTMSTAVFNRSSILFRMFQSKDPFEVDELAMDLRAEATNFTVARETFVELELSENKINLLAKQASMSILNTVAIDTMINDLLAEDYESASLKLNNDVLPMMKNIVNTIDLMQKDAQETAKARVLETKKTSNDEVNSILLFNLFSVLISLFLMIFLIRKQKQSNSDLSYLANTDTLTNLSNRDNFIKQIDNSIELEPNVEFSIIFFDVDYFKSINDITTSIVLQVLYQDYRTILIQVISLVTMKYL